MAAVTICSDFGAQENSPSICHELLGPDAMVFIYWMLSFKPGFSLSSFIFISAADEKKEDKKLFLTQIYERC